MSANQEMEWRWFSLGCLFVAAALVAFFWGFALGELSSSQHFLLMWLLPLTSGFACGFFAGSVKLTGSFGNCVVAATGGFAVWLLTYFLLPQPVNGSNAELVKMLEKRHAGISSKLDHEESRTSEPAKFAAVRKELEANLAEIRDASKSKQDIRAREATKDTMKFLDSERAKGALPANLREEFKNECHDPRIRAKKLDTEPST